MHDAVDDVRTGWVYRSDTARPSAPPPPASIAAAPRFAPFPAPPPRFTASPPPPHPPSAQASGGWVGVVTIMTLPLVITAGMMLAPLAWMWAARKSTNG